MNRIGKLFLTAAGAVALVGCATGTYQTQATDTQLSAYAGQAIYPQQIAPVQAPHVFCSIAPDASITLYNAGDESYTGFELWINRVYTIHVLKLDARSTLTVAPKDIYNKRGENLNGVPANSINMVQIFLQDKLWDVQGPILPRG